MHPNDLPAPSSDAQGHGAAPRDGFPPLRARDHDGSTLEMGGITPLETGGGDGHIAGSGASEFDGSVSEGQEKYFQNPGHQQEGQSDPPTGIAPPPGPPLGGNGPDACEVHDAPEH